jgi:IclR family acetate operon transcriptional repressor
LLEVLVESNEPVSIRQIAEETGQSRSTAHRTLQRLAEEGMVEQAESGSYRLGSRVLEFAARVLGRSSIVNLADSICEELVELTNETAYVALLSHDRGHGVHVHRVDSTEPLRFLLPRGAQFPLYAGAAGKAILAFLPPSSIPEELTEITPNTVTDPQALERELETIRRQGYSVTYEERVRGASGVGAPLRVRGQVYGSLTLSVPMARVPDEGLDAFGPIVASFAERISVAMASLGTADFLND